MLVQQIDNNQVRVVRASTLIHLGLVLYAGYEALISEIIRLF